LTCCKLKEAACCIGGYSMNDCTAPPPPPS
jgi:hypothetical protein